MPDPLFETMLTDTERVAWMSTAAVRDRARRRVWHTRLAMVADKRLRPDLLLGEVIGLEDAGAALAAMDHPPASAGMTVIDMAL